MVSSDAVRFWEAVPRFIAFGPSLQAAFAEQQGRMLLWTPVAFTCGVWVYFALLQEPTLLATLALAVAAILIARTRSAAAILLAVAISGFVLVKIRAELAATPLIRATTSELVVTGIVEQVERSRGKRLTLIVAPKMIEGIAPDATPLRLRLSMLQQHGVLEAGDKVVLKARVAPLPTPVLPGGFDHGRRLWFEGVGGVGRVTAPVSVLGKGDSPLLAFTRLMTSIRLAIANRIALHLEGTAAAVAEALITEERAEIPPEANRSLQASGLFHVLSISGLHMWMVAGSVFWTVRALLALSPTLALRRPIKKWSAGAALIVALFYLLLADSGVATTRSFIMIAVVFFAVLVDRPALSMRNLAIAALIVLLLQPEAAVDAGFQMSFLAVLGLVCFHGHWNSRTLGREAVVRSWPHRLLRHLATVVALALATTAVAGVMSSIPAAYHFGRLAPYSLVANGLAFPVIGILVMPMALLATVLMPLALEGLPLVIMGQGLDLVIAISDLVAGFPNAQMMVAQPSALAAILLAGGSATFCLLAGKLRLTGAVVAVAGLLLANAGRTPPDVLVDATAGNVAIRNGDGLLVPALARKSRFSIEKWLQADGDAASPGQALKRHGWHCEKTRCEAVVKGKRLAYVAGDESVGIACGGLDVLISKSPLRGACREVPLRLDRFDVWRSGAHALRIANGGVHVETVRESQGFRPWRVSPVARRSILQ